MSVEPAITVTSFSLMSDTVNTHKGRNGRILVPSLLSFLVAVCVFVVFVLPAEYGRDPTGLGKLMGIDGISAYSVGVLSLEEESIKKDEIVFTLEPFESIEYKYRLAAGQSMIFSWDADEQVIFDFHSEEEGTDPDDAVSFEVGKGSTRRGTYVAPFDGIHGWFWENRGAQSVEVRLTTTGFYPESITYSPSGKYKRAF